MPHAQAPLSLDVRPAFCLEPCSVELTLAVDPHQADRELVVEGDSTRFFRSSVIQLEGDDGPSRAHVVWKGLPAGNVRIRATLRRANGDAFQVDGGVRVVGS